ncbi:MAG: bile acid:sodium symporter family protein [Desulfovibrio sp.]|nr:bile acid:sodium symporter family protein [Desulfovibrio sp.]
MISRLNSLISKQMFPFILVVSALALFLPKGFLWLVPHIPLMLGVVMFGMGTMLTFEDFRLIFQRPRDILIGVAAQYTIMPLVAFLLVHVFSLPPEVAVGVLLVGCCPGGTASNVITYLAKGDVALSVSLTMVTTLLSPIVTPLLMLVIAGERIDVPFLSMMLSICQVVLLPVLLGIIVNRLFQRVIQKIKDCLPTFSIVVIAVIIGCVISVNATKLLEVGLATALVVMLHNLAGLALGYMLTRWVKMEANKAKAITIEVGMQNSGLAASLAITYFGAAAALPGAIFSVWHNLSGSILANYFARK